MILKCKTVNNPKSQLLSATQQYYSTMYMTHFHCSLFSCMKRMVNITYIRALMLTQEIDSKSCPKRSAELGYVLATYRCLGQPFQRFYSALAIELAKASYIYV